MGTRLTKQSLADRLIQNGTWTAEQVEAFVDAFFAVLQEGVTNDGSVKLRGLGTFKTVQVADRASVDVNTGERIVIPGHKKLKFVEEEKVNQLLNNPELVSEPVQEPAIWFAAFNRQCDSRKGRQRIPANGKHRPIAEMGAREIGQRVQDCFCERPDFRARYSLRKS